MTVTIDLYNKEKNLGHTPEHFSISPIIAFGPDLRYTVLTRSGPRGAEFASFFMGFRIFLFSFSAVSGVFPFAQKSDFWSERMISPQQRRASFWNLPPFADCKMFCCLLFIAIAIVCLLCVRFLDNTALTLFLRRRKPGHRKNKSFRTFNLLL
jgi:hypothetical protein